MSSDWLLEQAASVADTELQRARGSLRGIDPAVAVAVERTAHAVAAGIALCLAETAERDPSLAQVLLAGVNGARRHG
jgi:hypothetical protein